MARPRHFPIRSPGLSALAAMIAMVAIAWGMPMIGASSPATTQSLPYA